MKFAVINGSPKGKYSITLQTIEFIKRKFPEHEFNVIHAGQLIKSLEKDFSSSKSVLESSDAVIFSYPVYTFLAPSQLHRFIELIKESGVNLRGKYSTQISTSKHFYDVTAHKYIEENTLDLGMRYIRGLSADMEDLLTKKGQNDAMNFFERFLWSLNNGIYAEMDKKALGNLLLEQPTIPEVPASKSDKYDVVVITDVADKSANTFKMIERFLSDIPL